jgi:hypothetical protein
VDRSHLEPRIVRLAVQLALCIQDSRLTQDRVCSSETELVHPYRRLPRCQRPLERQRPGSDRVRCCVAVRSSPVESSGERSRLRRKQRYVVIRMDEAATYPPGNPTAGHGHASWGAVHSERRPNCSSTVVRRLERRAEPMLWPGTRRRARPRAYPSGASPSWPRKSIWSK